jgi:hypothetical protein
MNNSKQTGITSLYRKALVVRSTTMTTKEEQEQYITISTRLSEVFLVMS